MERLFSRCFYGLQIFSLREKWPVPRWWMQHTNCICANWGKWTRIGYYGSICNQFSPLDLKQEEEDWKLKQRVIMITDLVRKSRKMFSEDFETQLKRIDEFRWKTGIWLGIYTYFGTKYFFQTKCYTLKINLRDIGQKRISWFLTCMKL